MSKKANQKMFKARDATWQNRVTRGKLVSEGFFPELCIKFFGEN